MSRQRIVFRVALLLLLIHPATAWAGMPSQLLSDVARTLRLTESAEMRFQAISFFLATLLAAAFVVRWLWNFLVRDFPRLPRMTYGKSLAVVVLWGLLFLVVLTMIATTRETMTPGAWQKQGLLYQLTSESREKQP